MSRGPDDPVPGLAGWLLVSLATPPSNEALMLVAALRRLGARSVERDGTRVVALFPPHDDPDHLAGDIRVAARASTSLPEPDLTWRRVGRDERPERWRVGHPPRRVSDRLVIAVEPGSGDDPRPGDGVIRLEPSLAFGTAEHPTTRSCLRMLDARVATGDRVLDVGAGSGVLSIAAVLLGARQAVALESDPVSCAAARRNGRRNGVDDRVRVEEVEVVPGSLRGRGRYNGVLANVAADVVRPLMGDLARVLAADGWLVVSGIVPSEREAVLAAADAVGLRPVVEEVEEGWWTARLGR